MKHFYFFLFGALALISWNVKAAEIPLENFEGDDALNVSFAVNHDVNATQSAAYIFDGVVANPSVTALNPSSSAYKVSTVEDYQATVTASWSKGIAIKFSQNIPADKYISILVYTDLNKLEFRNNGNNDGYFFMQNGSRATSIFDPPVGEWFEIVVKPRQNDPLLAGEALNLCIDSRNNGAPGNDQGGPNDGGRYIYFDEITLVDSPYPNRALAAQFSEPAPESYSFPVLANFESVGAVTTTKAASNIGLIEGVRVTTAAPFLHVRSNNIFAEGPHIVNNPDKTGINTTDKCIHVKTVDENPGASSGWRSGILLTFDRPISVADGYRYLQFMVKTNATKLERVVNYTHNTTIFNGANAPGDSWINYYVDLQGLDPMTCFDICMDIGDGGVRGKDYWIDEIVLTNEIDKFNETAPASNDPDSQRANRIAYPYAMWTGGVDSNLINAGNWLNGFMPVTAETDVFVLGNADFYPELAANAAVNNITLEYGANIGNPNFLSYTNATVLVNLGALEPAEIPEGGSLPVELSNLTTTFSGAMSLTIDIKGCESNLIILQDKTTGQDIILKGEDAIPSSFPYVYLFNDETVANVSDRFAVLFGEEEETPMEENFEGAKFKVSFAVNHDVNAAQAAGFDIEGIVPNPSVTALNPSSSAYKISTIDDYQATVTASWSKGIAITFTEDIPADKYISFLVYTDMNKLEFRNNNSKDGYFWMLNGSRATSIFDPPAGEWFEIVVKPKNNAALLAGEAINLCIDSRNLGAPGNDQGGPNNGKYIYFDEMILVDSPYPGRALAAQFSEPARESYAFPLLANFEQAGVATTTKSPTNIGIVDGVRVTTAAPFLHARSSNIFAEGPHIVDNPDNTGINKSDKCIHVKMVDENPTMATSWRSGLLLSFDRPISAADGYRYLQFMVKTNATKMERIVNYTHNTTIFNGANAPGDEWVNYYVDLNGLDPMTCFEICMDINDGGVRGKDYWIDEIALTNEIDKFNETAPASNNPDSQRANREVGAYTWEWTGAEDNNWNNGNNWSGGLLPFPDSDVVLSAGAPNYPVLDNSQPADMGDGKISYNDSRNVTLEYGVNIANPALLSYAEAIVLIDLSALEPATIPEKGPVAVELSNLTTTFSGAMSLTLDWEGCEAKYITLWDKTEKKEIPLKGGELLRSANDEATYVYLFNEEAVKSVSGRFAVIFANELSEEAQAEEDFEGHSSLFKVSFAPNHETPATGFIFEGAVPNPSATALNPSSTAYKVSTVENYQDIVGSAWSRGIAITFADDIPADKFISILICTDMNKIEFRNNPANGHFFTMNGSRATSIFDPPAGEWFEIVVKPKESGALLASEPLNLCIDSRNNGAPDNDQGGPNNGKYIYFDEIMLTDSPYPGRVLATQFSEPARESYAFPLLANFEAVGVATTTKSASNIGLLEGVRVTTAAPFLNARSNNIFAEGPHIVDNPDKSGINKSDKCVHVKMEDVNPGVATGWRSGILFSFDRPISAADGYRYLQFMVKTNATKLERIVNYTYNMSIFNNDSNAPGEEWFNYYVDLQGLDPMTCFEMCMDIGDAGVRGKDYWIDEIALTKEIDKYDDVNPAGNNPFSQMANREVGAYRWEWTGAEDNDWNNGNNWSGGLLPLPGSDVVIPAGLSKYPVLDDSQPVDMGDGKISYNDSRNITLEYGANIANPELLSYAKATVLVNVGAIESTVTVPAKGSVETGLSGLTTTFPGAMSITLDIDGCNANFVTLWDEFAEQETKLKGDESLLRSAEAAPYVYLFNEEAVESVNDRFSVLFANDMTTSLYNTALTGIEAYREGDIIRLRAAEAIRQIFVYNTQGMLLYANAQVDGTTCIIQGNQLPAICIVKVVTASGVKNVKLK